MMEVVDPRHCRPPDAGSAVTIGAYDGVHLGHRAVLSELAHRATERGLLSSVVTFDRHPATVVRPESAPLLLTDLEQKLELLASCGIDRTVVVPFDRQRADETAEDFVSDVLVTALGARLVVVGQDFHFGHGRKGNVAALQELGADLGFAVEGFALEDRDGEVVSSTRIRRLIADGEVEAAGRLLGRDHELRGRVIRGDGRGARELGIPTANLELPPGLALPADGIYAGWYTDHHGRRHQAALSLGRRPTFYERAEDSLLEAHLLDFSGDLYGQPARVAFRARLHEERRYEEVAELVAQMEADVAETRRVLAATLR